MTSPPLLLADPSVPRFDFKSLSRRLSGLEFAFILALSLFLFDVSGCCSAQKNETYRPIFQGKKPDPELFGNWRSRGYGYLLVADASGIQVFSEAGGFRWREVANEPDILNNLKLFRLAKVGKQAVFASNIGETAYVFDRTTAPFKSRLLGENASKAEIFDAFQALMKEQFAYFDRHGVDWKERVATFRPLALEAHNDEALFKVLTDCLQGLNDPHLTLTAEIAGKPLRFKGGRFKTQDMLSLAFSKQTTYATPREFNRFWMNEVKNRVFEKLAPASRSRSCNDFVIRGMLPGNVGYLFVSAMTGYSEDGANDEETISKELDEMSLALRSAKAFIVDVSCNQGGEDRISRLIANRFTDKKRLAYAKTAFGARGVAPQPFFIEPIRGKEFSKPVLLLTSDITVSAADIFTICMRTLPHVEHFGRTTRGATSDALPKSLPNGWLMTLSNEIYRDSHGISIETLGVVPRHPLEVFPPDDLFGGHSKAIDAILETLK